MKLLLQRVGEASVSVGEETVGRIDAGLLILACADPSDTPETLGYLARKVAAMRIFSDEKGRMNRSVRDAGGAVLAVSQFTLAARWKNGNRPGFSDAAPPEQGRRLFDEFCGALREQGLHVESGRFGAEMQVSLVNDGPVTIWLDSENPR